MQLIDACPNCGIGRPSWLGSSHFRMLTASAPTQRVCEIDKRPLEEVYVYPHIPRRWPVG
jgi:hypothetical protein